MSKKPYMFDTNSFDSDVFDEEEFLNAELVDEEPPAPTYNDEQLEVAKSESYKRGKMDGFRESEEGISREMHTVTEAITGQLRDLADNEGLRRDIFEKDVVSLVKTIFKQAFPLTMQAKGLDEIFALTEDVLSEHLGNSKVIIKVTEKHAEPVQNFITSKFTATPETVEIQIDETLSGSDCKITWENGGAIRDLSQFEEKIETVFSEALAQSSDKAQNEKIDKEKIEKSET